MQEFIELALNILRIQQEVATLYLYTALHEKAKKVDKRRLKLWITLSELYLDTELQASDYKWIARELSSSAYTFAEIQNINKHEVFPILFLNLWSVAGVWTGFDKKWLENKCSIAFKRRNYLIRKFWINILFFFNGSSCRKELKEIEKYMV